MVHRNARLTPRGRRLLVDRVRSGQPIAHVAKAMGVSRQCAHRWINRFNEAGHDGLEDRSSRPHTCPNQTAPAMRGFAEDDYMSACSPGLYDALSITSNKGLALVTACAEVIVAHLDEIERWVADGQPAP